MNKNKILISAALGNVLEFYDFSLIGFFSPVIASTFFSQEDPLSSLFQVLSIIWQGFSSGPWEQCCGGI